MDEQFQIVMNKIQSNTACHQKNIKILERLYLKADYREFRAQLFTLLKPVFYSNNFKNTYVETTLQFLANFISSIMPKDEVNQAFEDEPSHPFLTDVITETLKYHAVAKESVRYNSCLFIRLILQSIGVHSQLDNNICDSIQEAMLERTLDRKSVIRHQAVVALVRLQNPYNSECPVIKAYLSLIKDPNVQIRAEVVKTIAPLPLTIPHILQRLKDSDINVRITALRRFADFDLNHIKITERQHIVKCGLSENNGKAQKVFEIVLSRWLRAFNGNFISLLSSLKLDAEESDILNTEEISKGVMNVYLKNLPICDLISASPVNENKVIPLEKLSTETVLFWSILSNYLRHRDDMDEYLDETLPELSAFCSYMEQVINIARNKQMEEWEYLEFQHVLFILLDIAEGYDFSDEVGRKKLYEFVTHLYQDTKIHMRVVRKCVTMANNLKPDFEDFTSIMCCTISDLHCPMVAVEQPVNQTEKSNNEYEIATLKVKLIRLQCDMENALSDREFLKANDLQKNIDEVQQQIEEKMQEPVAPVETVRVPRDDREIICYCLNLLIATLEQPDILEMTPSLISTRDEFVLPLLNNRSEEIHWRVLNCLALFAYIDEKFAGNYVKVICLPVITYKVIPNYNKTVLIVSVKAISDLFRIYGAKVFASYDDFYNATNMNNTTRGRRRLYRDEELEEILCDPNRFCLETIIDIILDMLDDEDCDIEETAVVAIAGLVLTNFPVTPPFMTRLILKWFNPITVKGSQKLQQALGILIGNYVSSIRSAGDIIAKAIVPIVTSVAAAPKASPLADVEINNLLKFLASMTNSDSQNGIVNNNHITLAHMLLLDILKTKNPAVIFYLTKLLTFLDIPRNNAIRELITQSELILEEVSLDKLSRKYMMSFLQRLNDILNEVKNTDSNLETRNEELTSNSKDVNETEATEVTQIGGKEKSNTLNNGQRNRDGNENISGHVIKETNTSNNSNELTVSNNAFSNAQDSCASNNKSETHIESHIKEMRNKKRKNALTKSDVYDQTTSESEAVASLNKKQRVANHENALHETSNNKKRTRNGKENDNDLESNRKSKRLRIVLERLNANEKTKAGLLRIADINEGDKNTNSLVGIRELNHNNNLNISIISNYTNSHNGLDKITCSNNHCVELLETNKQTSSEKNNIEANNVKTLGTNKNSENMNSNKNRINSNGVTVSLRYRKNRKKNDHCELNIQELRNTDIKKRLRKRKASGSEGTSELESDSIKRQVPLKSRKENIRNKRSSFENNSRNKGNISPSEKSTNSSGKNDEVDNLSDLSLHTIGEISEQISLLTDDLTVTLNPTLHPRKPLRVSHRFSNISTSSDSSRSSPIINHRPRRRISSFVKIISPTKNNTKKEKKRQKIQ